MREALASLLVFFAAALCKLARVPIAVVKSVVRSWQSEGAVFSNSREEEIEEISVIRSPIWGGSGKNRRRGEIDYFSRYIQIRKSWMINTNRESVQSTVLRLAPNWSYIVSQARLGNPPTKARCFRWWRLYRRREFPNRRWSYMRGMPPSNINMGIGFVGILYLPFFVLIGLIWGLYWCIQRRLSQAMSSGDVPAEKATAVQPEVRVTGETGAEKQGEAMKVDEVVPKVQVTGATQAEKQEDMMKIDEVAAGIQAMAMDQVVEFSMDDVATGVQWAKMSLLGRLFMENPPSLAVISKIVNGEWNCAVEVRVLEAEMGLL
ncbi:unnamed protein product [Linum trigynum]|uniref:Uncharacterized protein n=1 Tax=Linum trigynum TaxID=586398 RepID=A0AAV2CCT1_9ROSI